MTDRIARMKRMWKTGHSGFVDFSIRAQNVKPFEGGEFKISNRSDITDMDLPVRPPGGR